MNDIRRHRLSRATLVGALVLTALGCRSSEPPFEWNGALHEVVVEVGRQMPPDPGVAMRVALASE